MLIKIGIEEISDEHKEALIEELDAIKQVALDSDKKTEIEKKEKVKKLLGHSPDLADMLMMRMYFELFEEPDFYFEMV